MILLKEVILVGDVRMYFTEQQLDKIIKEHQAFFDTGITKSSKFRMEQLTILKKMIKKYEKDVIQALYQDLKKK